MIDAHHHLWQLGQFDYSWLGAPALTPIRRSFLPADLAPLLREVGVEQTIVVQTQHNVAENRWALTLADEHPFIAGVVGWVDLASPQCEDQVLEFKSHPKFVGVRHVTQDEPDDDFIIRPDVLRGLQTLQKHQVPFDLLFYVKHLHHVPRLARELPELPMVIDHLAKPRIKDKGWTDWAPHLQAAAQFPNVYCKLSGMITEANWSSWSAADLRPYVQLVLEAFGPNRCMFGSDWPVCLLAGSYAEAFAALQQALGPLSPAEQSAIFSQTARQFYQLRS